MELAQHGDVRSQTPPCSMSYCETTRRATYRCTIRSRSSRLQTSKANNKHRFSTVCTSATCRYIKEDTIWSYLIQMCNGMDELHSRKILHRVSSNQPQLKVHSSVLCSQDIKPKNVFLTGKNHIRVGDLGCAKLMKGGMARTQIGTPYYMSPEIWSHRPYDQKSDIWALGAMLYELCMLNPPFLANDINALARKVKTAPTPRISKHYSTELHAIINAMLNKNPTARPSVAEILSNPSVTGRLHLAPAADGSKWVDERESAMLATIKVPRYMGYGAANGLKLPEAAYPTDRAADDATAAAPSRRPETSPAKAQRALPQQAPRVRPVSAVPSAKAPVVASHGLHRVPSAAGLGYKESKLSAAPSTRYSRAPSSRGAVGRSAAVAGHVPSSVAIPSRAGLGKPGVPSSHRPTAAAARRYGAAAAAVGRRGPSSVYQAPAGYRGVSSRPW
jgi:hypothetical protein